MASENRQILFSQREFAQALVLYARQTGERLESRDAQIGLNARGELRAEFRRPGDKPLSYSASDILSALIFFCIRCRIPLPRSAPKTLTMIGEDVALVISNWRFPTGSVSAAAAH